MTIELLTIATYGLITFFSLFLFSLMVVFTYRHGDTLYYRRLPLGSIHYHWIGLALICLGLSISNFFWIYWYFGHFTDNQSLISFIESIIIVSLIGRIITLTGLITAIFAFKK